MESGARQQQHFAEAHVERRGCGGVPCWLRVGRAALRGAARNGQHAQVYDTAFIVDARMASRVAASRSSPRAPHLAEPLTVLAHVRVCEQRQSFPARASTRRCTFEPSLVPTFASHRLPHGGDLRIAVSPPPGSWEGPSRCRLISRAMGICNVAPLYCKPSPLVRVSTPCSRHHQPHLL